MKKFIAILLFGIILVCFAACGEEANTNESEVKSMEELLDYHAFATDNVKTHYVLRLLWQRKG